MVKWLSLLAVLALGCDGSPQLTTPQSPTAEEKDVREPPSGNIESLLAQVEAIPAGTKSFELFVPQSITLEDRPMDQNLAMAVVLDKLLGKGLFPDGFDQRPNGRRYKYKSD